VTMETRACREEELDEVLALVNRVFRPEGGGDMRREYPLVFDRDHLEGVRIVRSERGPVAHVGVCIREAVLLGARVRVASIGAVCTHPEERGRGLASALMEDARRYARERGAGLMLISGGRGLYHRLGYVTVGCFQRYEVTPADLNGAGVPGIELSGYREQALAEVVALHQAEPVRFLRPAADWRRLLGADVLMNAPAELLTVRQDSHLVAYLGVQTPRASATGERVVRVQEMAGSRRAVLAAMAAVLERHAAARLVLTAPESDVELAVLARQHGWNRATVSFPGTLGVIDPPVVLNAVQPLWIERDDLARELSINATAESVRFELGPQSYEVAAPGPIAALLFGGDTEEARALPPCEGALGALLARLFPLPLLWYGYNYV
jgi:predicted N-acetyltransferase YhbS